MRSSSSTPVAPLMATLLMCQAPRWFNATQNRTSNKLLFRAQRHFAQTKWRKRAGSQLSLTLSGSFEKVAKGPLARLLGRIAHLVKPGINQRQAASSHILLQRIRRTREIRMTSHGTQASCCTFKKVKNPFRWKDDPLTSSTNYPRSWARRQGWAKGVIDPSELGRAPPVFDGTARAAGLIDSRAGNVMGTTAFLTT